MRYLGSKKEGELPMVLQPAGGARMDEWVRIRMDISLLTVW